MTTALTRLSAVRMQLAEVLATECAGCGHTLKQHPLSMSEGTRCHHHDVKRGHLVYCKCKSWVDVGDQLALQPKDASDV